nr:immunoglobulin heavy chain junction region [Mus musculus]MBK4196614.1 immunoglobulin heavy chain junction region [Mus musculus]
CARLIRSGYAMDYW